MKCHKQVIQHIYDMLEMSGKISTEEANDIVKDLVTGTKINQSTGSWKFEGCLLCIYNRAVNVVNRSDVSVSSKWESSMYSSTKGRITIVEETKNE